jgi:carboxyl-terminal processing protease
MPFCKTLKHTLIFFLLVGFWAGFGQDYIGDSLSGVAAAADGDVRTAVTDGARLERSRQWLQAIDHYKRAVKHWPENKQLTYGLRRSRIHFGIDRRYEDDSFGRKLRPKTLGEAILVFDETLSRVRANYVETLSFTSFVAHGTESFYLALGNQKFLDKNLRGADREQIGQLRQVLRENYWNKPITDRNHARDTVIQVCEIARQKIGMVGGPIVMEYVFGGCNALDDYSTYLTPNRLDDLYGNIDGEFVGLGIEMKSEMGKGLLLINVLSDSPAEEGGLEAGDYIVGIEKADCRHMTTDEAARLLRGPAGSRVRLSVMRGNAASPRQGQFARRAVRVKSIPIAKIIDRDNGVGYIRMTGFQRTTAAELDRALDTLKAQGMRSLIWDVRGNPGGLLTASVEVLDRFIDEGVLVSTKGRTRDQNWTYSAHRAGTWNIPLVLLIDGMSASASEIVAGAIEDHGRGQIVGRTTYGKWSVQSIFPLRDSTGLRLTTAKFYSPSGRTLGKIGVKPNVAVKLSSTHRTNYRASKLDVNDDADIRAALQILRRQITRR